MKIFLLEDDFALNESIKDMLESENFIVDSFYDGKVALDHISGDYELLALQVSSYGAIINQMEVSFSGLKMLIQQSTASN